MRVDVLTAHENDLGERIGQLFGVNVYDDPDSKTRLREISFRRLLIAMGKLNNEGVAFVQETQQRPSRAFPLFDCMMAQTNDGTVVRLEQRPDALWNIVSHEGSSTWGADEATVFSLTKPLKIAQ